MRMSTVTAAALVVSLNVGTAVAEGRAAPVDYVLVEKTARKLVLIRSGKRVREYRIALGDAPAGHKQREGDERTPEGTYLLDWRNAESQYYKSIHVSYPNADDVAAAETRGEAPGGMIMIHGEPNEPRYPRWYYQSQDWTDGCIAVTNEAMDEIWLAVRDNTPIHIHP
ncbi:MAG: L,D-transpeptidase family protein [Pseudomonadota bacterium]|nr:L,D-transpeptidase family protein [Pseudomonadota bacterium]